MIFSANPPIDLPIEKLTAAQKWELFQFLWQDVVEDHENDIAPPSWHEPILRQRLEKIESGKAVWQDLDQAFDDLRNELK
ncbi:putative addiction module component [Prosthecobacter fusiformis]|uniref:Putative addiction module component n=1 Tax=Prosthecobacter fusiformis TaxID=48464 RepID=A0A4R7S3G6_9BACT|nr:addiction module protein [Prosthecobacter fusiformis]TDU72932.1 putative addiction module component [Prosthecobacter fusiformis]